MADATKLVFKPHIKSAHTIKVQIPNVKKMYVMTKEQILASILAGNEFLVMKSLFTAESIAEALKPKKESKKDNKEDESKN